MKKNKPKSKASPRNKKVIKSNKKNILIALIFLFVSIILFILAINDTYDIRQRAANIPDQKVAVDACIPSGGTCKPAGSCLSNETNLGQLDCSADNSLTCCKLANTVPTVPGDSDIDGSTCRSKGGNCQQKGFCPSGQGGAEEDCSNDGSNWCCMAPQQTVPTLPGFTPSAAPTTVVPSPGCLGSCPTMEPTASIEPTGTEPGLSTTPPADGDNPGEIPPGGGENGLIGLLLGFLLAILEFFMRLFGGGRG